MQQVEKFNRRYQKTKGVKFVNYNEAFLYAAKKLWTEESIKQTENLANSLIIKGR